MTTVLTPSGSTHTSAAPDPNALWLEPDVATAVSGWAIKPEGFCKGDICVPVPPDRVAEFVRDDAVNIAELWALLGKPAACSQDGDVWLLGEDAQTRNDALLSLEAPDFTLPDFDGKLHSLTDFRRQQVLLITWASW